MSAKMKIVFLFALSSLIFLQVVVHGSPGQGGGNECIRGCFKLTAGEKWFPGGTGTTCFA